MKNEIKQHIGSVALVVNDYDEAIAFYTEKLQFTLIEDTDLGEGKRWVLVSPPGSNGTHLLLAKPVIQQMHAVGNQTVAEYFCSYTAMIFGVITTA